MNLQNKSVRHIKFGVGKILSYSDCSVEVEFSEEIGVKAFVYPSAFESFLTFAKPELQEAVLEQIQSEKESVSEKYRLQDEEKLRLREEERLALLKEKRLAAQKLRQEAKKAKEAQATALEGGQA